MRSNEFFTWNRVLNIAVLDGRLPPDELRDRTLNFVFTDQSVEFDHIEWQLDNSDGMFTRPEYTMAGLFVAMQLGYEDGAIAYRTFVINRMTGGVGVWGKEQPAVGESERTITFYGRNRNAPGGRTGHRSLPKTARAPATGRGGSNAGVNKYNKQGHFTGSGRKGSGGRKTYGPTMGDPTVREMLLDQRQPARWIPGNTTSEVVRTVLAEFGIVGDLALVEDTYDDIYGAQIPQGESAGSFLQREASRLGWVCKLDGYIFHFHSAHWEGAKTEFADILDYGSSPDILSISIDCDFQMPVPKSVKAKSYNPRTRYISSGDVSYDQSQNQPNMSIAAINGLVLDDAGRANANTREDVFPVLANTQLATDAKAQQWFIQRHQRAFQLSVETVGNPKLLATRLVQIRGTGSPFVDNVWTIGVARHTISSNDYKTTLRLTFPKKGAAKGTTTWFSTGDVKYDTKNQKSAQGMGQLTGYIPTPKNPARPPPTTPVELKRPGR